jgi:alcohol dehydrogenase
MHALVFNGDLHLRTDYPEPEVAQGEALIRVNLAGICNTDLEITRGYMSFHGVLGHEFVGVVEAASDPTWIGQRVVGEINCYCGTCPTCLRGDRTHCPSRTTLGIQGRDGAMAEYTQLPLGNLHHVPDSLTDEQAVFVEPLAAALEILDRVYIRPSDQVIVVGDGKLGLLVAQVLHLTGCTLQVVGRHPSKLSMMQRQGIGTCLEEDVRKDIRGDVVVDCTGKTNGFALSRQLVRPRGTLVLKSTYSGDNRVDLTSVVVDEVRLIGSRCGPFAPALHLLERGLIDLAPMLEGTYPLAEGNAAFSHAARKGALKVLLKPSHVF